VTKVDEDRPSSAPVVTSKFKKGNYIKPILIVNGIEQSLNSNDVIEEDDNPGSSYKSISRKESLKVIAVRQEFKGVDYKSPEKTRVFKPESEVLFSDGNKDLRSSVIKSRSSASPFKK
jgi:hypothetical protein